MPNQIMGFKNEFLLQYFILPLLKLFFPYFEISLNNFWFWYFSFVLIIYFKKKCLIFIIIFFPYKSIQALKIQYLLYTNTLMSKGEIWYIYSIIYNNIYNQLLLYNYVLRLVFIEYICSD